MVLDVFIAAVRDDGWFSKDVSCGRMFADNFPVAHNDFTNWSDGRMVGKNKWSALEIVRGISLFRFEAIFPGNS